MIIRLLLCGILTPAFAADEAVDPGVYITVIRYGVLTAGLWFADGTVKATYRYLSLPHWMNPFRLF